MNSIIVRRGAFALGLGAIACAAALPAAAATPPKHKHVMTHSQPAPALPFGAHYGPDGIPYSAMGSPIPGYVLSTPDKCWVEDGYSQWSSCDGD